MIISFFLPFTFSLSQDTIKKGFQTTLVLGEGEQLLLEDADYFFSAADYQRALLKYLELDRKYPGTIDYKYRAAICILSIPGGKDQAIPMLEDARKIKPTLTDIDFYFARAYHLNYRFDDAIKMYKSASANPVTTPESKKQIARLIENCDHAKDLVSKPVEVTISNIGSPVNSEGAEYAPVITADESMLIFTYKGKKSTGGMLNEWGEPDPEGQYYEDIFMSLHVADKWQEPKSVGPTLNTKAHEASIGLSSNGQRLYVYIGSNGGDIYVSSLQRSAFSAPITMGENINSKYWEGSATLSADGTILYFSSDRPGGQGGKDIYVSKLHPDLSWGPAKNAGTVINTPFDEDAPSIHVSGAYLFFSSKGHNSMGGYDIFYSKYVNNGWTAPRNIGHPVNTPEDDMFYSVTATCDAGYFASAGKNSLGQQDIYAVKPGLPGQKPKMLVVKGSVTQSGKGVEADLKVINKTKNNEVFGTFSSSATGKFVIPLPAGNLYKMDVEVKGRVSHSETINLLNVDSFTNLDVAINLPAGKTAVDTVSVIQKQLNAKVSTEVLASAQTKSEAKEEEKKQQETEKKKQQEAAAGAVRAKLQADSVAKVNAEAKAKAEEEKKRQEAALTADLAAKAQAEAAAQAKAVAIATEQAKTDAEMKAKQEADAKTKAEEEKKRQEAALTAEAALKEAAQAKAAAELKVKQEAEAKAKSQADAKAKAEEEKKRQEAALTAEATAKAAAQAKAEKIISTQSANVNLIFKVQVGAYGIIKYFNRTKFSEFGQVDSTTHYGIVHYTIGRYSSFQEAVITLLKVVKDGVPDAYIVAELNGERKELCEVSPLFPEYFRGVKVLIGPEGGPCRKPGGGT